MTNPTHQASSLAACRPNHEPTRIAVTGGKGGVGKTIVAVNLSILARQAGYRTLLVDCDPGLGNVDVHLRLAPRHTLEDVGLGRCSVSEAVVAGPAGVHVLAGRSGSTQMLDHATVDAAHDAIRDASSAYDVVIFDTGAGIGYSVLEAVRRADTSVAITTPEPAAVTDAYALCKVLYQHGIALPGLVINRARTHDDAMRTAGRLAAICERFLREKPGIIGSIRDDRGLERSVVDQRPGVLSSDAPAVEDLRALSATLLSSTPGPRRVQVDQQRTAQRLLIAR